MLVSLRKFRTESTLEVVDRCCHHRRPRRKFKVPESPSDYPSSLAEPLTRGGFRSALRNGPDALLSFVTAPASGGDFLKK